MYCLECRNDIEKIVFNYSREVWGYALCRSCQDWIREQESSGTSEESIRLYFELKKRNVPAELEKFDGYKTIDIAVPKARINIEVDGAHHHFSRSQALADLKRVFYSFKKGYFTFRIPNTLVREHLEETADHLAEMINGQMM